MGSIWVVFATLITQRINWRGSGRFERGPVAALTVLVVSSGIILYSLLPARHAAAEITAGSEKGRVRIPVKGRRRRE
ncbi:hypothetical protein [Massilia horti]|uniref:Uncharacterized protein n=1 Tax=Massilia horti TaxID=2562153 RepID=A0A4Y9SSG6_9BURK|nr:hypothetical protein [Massilia horti]TFW29425.1 hypothetical protein E4O92_18960 [Massilia horti]